MTVSIVFEVRGAVIRRSIPVPTVVQARYNRVRKAVSAVQHPLLDELVAEYGQCIGAEMYCKQCFTHASLSRLEVKDGNSVVAKLI